MHDRIMRFALVREQAFLSVFRPEEVPVLIGMLRRLHANLPTVESVSDTYMVKERGAMDKLCGKHASAKARGN